MGLAGAPRTQLAKVKVVFYQGNHSGNKQPFFAGIQCIRFHTNGAQQHIHPLFLCKCLTPRFQLLNIHMRHLNGSKLTNLDGIAIFLFFFVILVFQLHNAPNAAAEQAVILLGILVVNRHVTQTQIGERSIELVSPNIQIDGNHIDNRMAAVAAELCKNLLGFIRADEVVRQNALDVLHALLDDFIFIRAAILPQQEFQNIDRYVGAFFDFLGQVLPHDFAVEGLTQLGLNDLASTFICVFHKSS